MVKQSMYIDKEVTIYIQEELGVLDIMDKDE